MGRDWTPDEGADDTRGRKQPGVKWTQDAKGREFRLEGATRIYRRSEDRDAAVEESYQPTAAVVLTMGDAEPTIMQAIARETVALAELFHREAAQMKRDVGTVDDQIDLWCRHHFGRTLEPSLRGMLAYQIRRTLELGHGGIKGPVAGYRDYAEQRAYERAAEDAPIYIPNTEDEAARNRVHGIATAAGADLGPSPAEARAMLTRVQGIAIKAGAKLPAEEFPDMPQPDEREPMALPE